MSRKRLEPFDRKVEILDAAIDLAEEFGYNRITRDAIAERAGCSQGLVSRHFGTMLNLQRSIMSAAIHRGNLIVLAQGLAANDSKARAAPLALRQQAGALIAGV